MASIKYNVFGLATTSDWKVKCAIWNCFEFDFDRFGPFCCLVI